MLRILGKIEVDFIGKSRTEQSFMILNINGYNIGNFSLPFISFFLEGMPILAISLFDAGSAIMVMGGITL